MSEYDFTFILDIPAGDLTEDDLDVLYEAGCSDGCFGASGGVPDAGFTREATDILEAITSGIGDIETAGVGATVLRVEPDDLLSLGDIAERTGRTAESIRLLIMGRRGPGGFPMPVMRVGNGRSRLWRWAEVVEWFHEYEPARWSDETMRYWSVIATVNDVLRQRALAARTDGVAVEVRAALTPALERGRAGAAARHPSAAC